MVISYFLQPAQTNTRKQDFYSKFIGQKERVNGFEYWRNRIYWYMEHSEFGIKILIEKKPILTILGNGNELVSYNDSFLWN